jgi:hypothetical protein
MVIHIVNGFPVEKPSFLQFICKSEQLGGAILARQNQIRRRGAPKIDAKYDGGPHSETATSDF